MGGRIPRTSSKASVNILDSDTVTEQVLPAVSSSIEGIACRFNSNDRRCRHFGERVQNSPFARGTEFGIGSRVSSLSDAIKVHGNDEDNCKSLPIMPYAKPSGGASGLGGP